MRKITFLAVFLLSMVLALSSASAMRQEWFASDYDFTRAKKIAVLFECGDHLNAIQGNEAQDIFWQKMKMDFVDKLPSGYEVVSTKRIANTIQQEYGVDLEKLFQTNPKNANLIMHEYIQAKFDLLLIWKPLVYDVGTQYQEGFVYSLPTTNTSTVWFSNGGSATIQSQGQQTYSIPGHNVEAIYVAVQTYLVDVKRDYAVWIRTDERAKTNPTFLDNTTPKDIYKRILGTFTSDLIGVLEKRTSTGSRDALF